MRHVSNEDAPQIAKTQRTTWTNIRENKRNYRSCDTVRAVVTNDLLQLFFPYHMTYKFSCLSLMFVHIVLCVFVIWSTSSLLTCLVQDILNICLRNHFSAASIRFLVVEDTVLHWKPYVRIEMMRHFRILILTFISIFSVDEDVLHFINASFAKPIRILIFLSQLPSDVTQLAR